MNSINSRCSAVAAATCIIVSAASFQAGADTILTKDGRQTSGIVLEEYKDRIVMATVDGELTLMKSEIAELRFDDEETNLIRLGDRARDRQKYLEAVGYYEKALQVNPDSKAAKDGLLYLQLHLQGMEATALGDELKKRQDMENTGMAVTEEKTGDEKVKELRREIMKIFGISLGDERGFPVVTGIREESIAFKSGMRKADTIFAIWGHLTGYMSTEEVMEHILKKVAPEIRCTIERTREIDVKPANAMAGPEELIGASFSMEFDGLTITGVSDGGPSESSGLEAGDLVVAIDDRSTRYMPLKKAVEMLRDAGGPIRLTIRRDITIWRRSET